MKSKLFEDIRLWKGKYKIGYCDLCETVYIACPEKDCPATSCNATSCEKCHADMVEFNEKVKTLVSDYLTQEEFDAYQKAQQLKYFMLESIREGEAEIDWKKMKEEGRLSAWDERIFCNLVHGWE